MVSPSPSFAVSTRIFPGLGVRHSLVEHIRVLQATRVALVGDGGLARLGLLGPFEEAISNAVGIELVQVAHSDIDPTINATEKLAAVLSDLDVDLVIGVGGGSALSLAKGAALLLRNPNPLVRYSEGVNIAANAPVPTIAIPTTAGSGAEVSSTFVLYDSEDVRSRGFTGHGYEPNIALLDGELLAGLPEVPMRDAALDAYSHAFEALWGRRATSFSTLAAFDALERIRTLLPRVLEDRRPDDLQGLLEASTLANIACGNAGLGLVHALTSSSHMHIAHGRQNGVALPHVAHFNQPLLSVAAASEVDLIHPFYDAIDAPVRFRPDEVPEGAAEAMVTAALASPLLANNVRPADSDQLLELARLVTSV